jgi:branched-chain amino acid transport system ATP-binding protein
MDLIDYFLRWQRDRGHVTTGPGVAGPLQYADWGLEASYNDGKTDRAVHPTLDAQMIRIETVSKHFGGIKAVDEASLEIARGSITGLIGPNGAGKTTLFNTIAGVYKPSGGTILLDGEDITGLMPHELFHKGLLRTFQIAHEFSKLTVLENLMMVPAAQTGEDLLGAWLKRRQVEREEDAIRRKAYEVIDFLNLTHISGELAGNLSGGQKKLLELGRTMMVDAKVVLLDEVGAGVNRTLLKDIGDAILRLNRERGYTFCMIEHDMDFISRLCNPVIVMAEGAVLAQGTAEEVKSNEQVIEAYLGRGLKSKRGGSQPGSGAGV